MLPEVEVQTMRFSRRLRSVVFPMMLATPVAAAAVGCGQSSTTSSTTEPNALSNGDPFVAIDRPLSAAAQSVAASRAVKVQAVPSPNAPQSFYLAINKKELGQRWFLTAYLKDYFPDGVGFGAPSSLGVRVVTFRVQNGKLFVFDASDNFATSTTFDPSLIIEAYPLVDSDDFNHLAGSDNYVLFDPAAGLNRFGALADSFATGSQPAHLQTDITYSQNFRKISDGVTFEQVFVGYSNDVPLNGSDSIETNAFRASGTLGLSLRRYAEGQGYVPSPLPPKEFYFRSDRHLVPNTGTSSQVPIKWNIHKGMKPITWLISDQIAALKDDPVFGAYDVFGAVKAGIENWNAVFGFQALEAKVATAADSFGDDDKNFIVYDGDPTFGFAFANWRSNPNTGEVRGASVYFNGIWLTSLSQFFDDPKPSGAAPQLNPAAAPHPVASLTWGDMRTDPLCVMWAPNASDLQEAFGSDAAVQPFRTKKQKFEAYISHVINHEVGHTLGLRHNFKGSLLPPSSSVMDYINTQDRSLLDKPQSYDIAAIKLLYGLSNDLPSQPFCTDGDVASDVNCSRFDVSADPLNTDAAPLYDAGLAQYLAGSAAPPTDRTLNRLLKFIKGGTGQQPLQAWNASLGAKGELKVPADANAVKTIPGYAARVDAAAARLFSRLYLDPAALRNDSRNSGTWLDDPPFDPVVTPLLINELKANLVNADSIRSYATRRIAVAVLKKIQVTGALDALVSARDTIRSTRSSLTGDDATLTDELLSRIDSAISNYFNQ